eukprot:364664-Chlamydomonas_euryale.AAC.17
MPHLRDRRGAAAGEAGARRRRASERRCPQGTWSRRCRCELQDGYARAGLTGQSNAAAAGSAGGLKRKQTPRGVQRHVLGRGGVRTCRAMRRVAAWELGAGASRLHALTLHGQSEQPAAHHELAVCKCMHACTPTRCGRPCRNRA